MSQYTEGFAKLTHTSNANRLFTPDAFNAVTTSEEMTAKIDELKASSGYNFYVMDRMASHNIQTDIQGNNRVLILGWGPKIAVNTQFMMVYIKEVTPINGGEYKMKFDVKYIDIDVREEAANTEGQNVIVDNPGYDPTNEIVEYTGIELTTEIGVGKKNWFAAYADNNMQTFTQEEARNKSSMMDFAAVAYGTDDIRLFTPYIGYKHASYKAPMAPYVLGFSKLTYMMMGGWGSGSYATKPEHYDNVTDVKTMTGLINSYRVGYTYPVADRMTSDKLKVGGVAVLGWGNHPQVNKTSFINNKFGIFIVRDLQPTNNGHYKVILDIKVPKSDARSMNNGCMVNNPDL